MWKYFFFIVAVGHLTMYSFVDFTATASILQPSYFLTAFWICFAVYIILKHIEKANKNKQQ